MKVADLRNAFAAGRPLVEQWLGIAVQMAALRDDCRTKQIDWQQVKSLLKAQIQDAEKGETKRVDAILAKADNATTYADALNLGSPEKKNSRAASQQTVSIAAGTASPAQKPTCKESLQVQNGGPVAPAPRSEQPTQTAQALQASVAIARAGGDPFEMPDIPAVLDRRPS